MCLGGIGLKTSHSQIASGKFPSIMIRRMVEVKTGDISDAEYELALMSTAQKLGLKCCDGKLDFSHMSLGTMDYISSRVAETVIAGRPEKAGAF